jgi:hypothetical protein
MPLYGGTDVGEGLKQIDVIEKIVGEPLGRFSVLLPRPSENLFQIGSASSW